MGEPILKWPGGKRKLLDELRIRAPEDYQKYHEPFFGGGALFFSLEPQSGSINDTIPRLANCYRQVRDNPDQVLNHLNNFKNPYAEPDSSRRFSDENRKGKEINEYYYQQRALFNNRPYGDSFDEIEEAALLIYLNKTCYNGLYRENNDGGFNAALGGYDDPKWAREEQIRNASRILQGITVKNTDFEYITDTASKDDFVYLDPPYEPMSTTANFTDYSASWFGKDDQERVLDVLEELDRNGVRFVVSNSGVEKEKYVSHGFRVATVKANRTINVDETSRGEVEEIIATNVSEEAQAETGQQLLTSFGE